jgi:hypothetical protein
MQLRNGIQTLDTTRPTFDPGLDIATEVFSHVQCVKTRVNLAVVSKLWRDASKPAAAYPRRFDWGAFRQVHSMHAYGAKFQRIVSMLDNDEALSLPYERVVGFLGETVKSVSHYAAMRGSVRLLKWTRENKLDWSANMCTSAARNGHLPAVQYLHENGCPWHESTCTSAASSGHLPVLKYLHENECPWDSDTCLCAFYHEHWDCFQYLVDNDCLGWEIYAEKYAKHLVLSHAYYKFWDCLKYAVDNKCPGWEYYAKNYAKHLR